MQIDIKTAPSSVIVQFFPVLRIVRDGWKIIATCVVLGVFAGLGALRVLPPKYQATVMIQMGQVPLDGAGSSDIEAALTLIARLNVPSTYSQIDLAACSLAIPEPMSLEAMSDMVSAAVPRSTNSIAVIRIRRESPAAAEKCSNALFEMIRNQQEAMAEPVKQDLQRALAKLEARLAKVQDELSNAEQKGRFEKFFFAKRDELFFLNQQIFSLHREFQRITPARLVSPIYASPRPVSPQLPLIITASTLAGLFLGLVVASFREFMRRHMDSSGNQA